ncbi:MAG: 3-phosphoshikimate 1-carboxyvinyltransferase [Sphingobacteriales bacterium]|nr:3-phosphoshikimate 1-carboxyvinyltransferase [Sphingobacteriales bacterium]
MKIRRPLHFQKQTLTLPGSKSESNRALIIQALSEEVISIDNLSNSDDTRIIQDALSGIDMIIDCNQSGAALRFLCAFFSIQENREIILTGSQRLKERPLKILVDALKELGADIEYLEKTGYAPIKIKGKALISHAPITIQADVSSQFISAMIMIGPKVKNGLQLHLENKIISAPYLNMTMEMMHEAKVHIILNDESIIIPEQEYEQCNFYIEPDWSAASYWYAMVSLGVEEIYLPGFKPKSTQGDAILAEWMRDWNVETTFEEDGIRLTHTEHFAPADLYDFVNCPDIAQTLITLSALRKHALKFTGVDSLRVKETDRLEAMQNELGKLGVEMLILDSGHWTLDTGRWTLDAGLSIESYHDHRMAMAFSILAMVVPEVTIEHPEVVSKSYPNFWKDMEVLGFSLSNG